MAVGRQVVLGFFVFFLVPTAAQSSAGIFNHFCSIPRGWVTNKNGNSYMPNEGGGGCSCYVGILCRLQYLNVSNLAGMSRDSSKQTWESTSVSSPKY